MNFSWPSILLYTCCAGGLLAVSGCDQLPGKPKESDRWIAPDAIKDFKQLFGTNCSAWGYGLRPNPKETAEPAAKLSNEIAGCLQ